MLPTSRLTEFPGSHKVDLFTKPTNSTGSYFETQSKSTQFPIQSTDKLLVTALNSVQKIEINDGIVQSYQPLGEQLLSKIQLYSSQYTGRVTPESLHGCQLIARKLGDLYSTQEKRFTRQQFLENDYMGILKNETEASRTLIGFGETSILPGIVDYFTLQKSYEQSRPEVLRETVATKYNGWSGSSQLTGKMLSLDSLKIYSVLESGATPGSKSPTEMYLIFAPVDVTEAGKVLLYLSRDIDLYSYSVYLSVKDLPVASGLDFQYLFPVELKYFQDYTLISSDQFTQGDLDHLWKFREVKFPFPDLEPIRGAYGAYLLSESMYYEFLVLWDQGALVLGLGGWLQMKDLLEHYTQLLNEINRERVSFEELPDFQAAVKSAKTTNFKSFYHEGKYYRAVTKVTPTEAPLLPSQISGHPNELAAPVQVNSTIPELIHPLRAVTTRDRIPALQYLEQLGYSVSPNPTLYQNKIKLGYRTYLNESDETKFTAYYYITTHKEEIELHETYGEGNQEVKDALEWALQQGFFFNQEMQNITRGYPEFTPGIPPINRKLSKYPQRLLQQIKNLKFR